MATNVTIGHGSTFAYGDGGSPEVFTDFAEVSRITPINFTRDTVDATHMASEDKYREFVPGMRDTGEISVTMNWIPGAAGEDAALARFAAETVSNYKITYPNSEAWTFAAFCTGVTPSEVAVDGKMEMVVRFKVTGKPTFLS